MGGGGFSMSSKCTSVKYYPLWSNWSLLYWSIYERDICRFENASGFLQHQIESLEKLLRIFSNITESQGGNFAKDKQSQASISYFKIPSSLFFFLVCVALYSKEMDKIFYIFWHHNSKLCLYYDVSIRPGPYCILYWGSSLRVKQRLTIRWFDMASQYGRHINPPHISLSIM